MLLNRTVLSLAKLASKDESRYTLLAIAVEKDIAAVMQGHYLVTVTHPKYSGDAPIEQSYPVTDGLTHRTIKDSEVVLVHKDAALAALKSLPKKSNIPILANAAMSEDGRLVTNDLAAVASFKHEVGGTFPNWRQVVPDAPVAFDVCLDPTYLELLMKFFKESLGDARNKTVRLTLYKDDKPMSDGRRIPRAVRFDARTDEGQEITAILMPIRGEDSQFPMRPDQVRAAEAQAEEDRLAAVEATNVAADEAIEADAQSQDAADMAEIPTPESASTVGE